MKSRKNSEPRPAGRYNKSNNPEAKRRKCLRCAKEFLSQGNWHRLCPSCKSYADLNDCGTPDPRG